MSQLNVKMYSNHVKMYSNQVLWENDNHDHDFLQESCFQIKFPVNLFLHEPGNFRACKLCLVVLCAL